MLIKVLYHFNLTFNSFKTFSKKHKTIINLIKFNNENKKFVYLFTLIFNVINLFITPTKTYTKKLKSFFKVNLAIIIITFKNLNYYKSITKFISNFGVTFN